MIKIEQIGSRWCGVDETGAMVPAGRTYKTRETLLKALAKLGLYPEEGA